LLTVEQMAGAVKGTLAKRAGWTVTEEGKCKIGAADGWRFVTDTVEGSPRPQRIVQYLVPTNEALFVVTIVMAQGDKEQMMQICPKVAESLKTTPVQK
jgi:hypothetical protein